MKEQEIKERGFTINATGKVIDDMGNEYRNENGEIEYIEIIGLLEKRLRSLIGQEITHIEAFNNNDLDSGFILTFEDGAKLTAQDGEYGDNAFKFLN